jgi:hypothetical protein
MLELKWTNTIYVNKNPCYNDVNILVERGLNEILDRDQDLNKDLNRETHILHLCTFKTRKS